MRFSTYFGIFLALAAAPAAAQPRVVTSFAPLQSIVAGVMEGIGMPEAIVKGGASPHTYAMRPSEARLIEEADLIFWVGRDYEAFLARPLAGLAGHARIVAMADLPGVAKLPARSGGVWEDDGDGHAHGKDAPDGHMFLDPRNMKALAAAAAAELARLDPANAARYAANATKTGAMLEALDEELGATLRPLSAKPLIVFHDAYQYLEKRYGLAVAGSITVSPERRPGAQRVQRIRDKVRRSAAICVFAEPQFEPALVRTIVEGTDARVATLDYVGIDIPPGPTAYAAIMRGLSRALSDCLSHP
ncbi:MAG: zinc ABC transporter substrate-binding protein [Proteobacteria bacterium]|nr:zinc ABC transporter substrate-binding protein [Pseudomonadota bacterium]